MDLETPNAPQSMTPALMVALVDAAFRHPRPLAFLDLAVTMFKMLDRHDDATATAWMGCLHAEGEIETLMSLRAAWQRGQARCPDEAARSAMCGSADHDF